MDADKPENHFNKKDTVDIRFGLKPGDAGDLIRWHGVLYHREYGFDHTFEAYVAGPLAEFIRRGSEREGIWIAHSGTDFMGSVAIVKVSDDAAQLRWLILRPEVRGQGLGRRLVSEALEFCRKNKYRRVFLWTLQILPQATGLYGSFGFKRVESKPERPIWGRNLVEERLELNL